MPKRRKILLLISIAIIVPLTFYLCRDTTSPDAKYRAWVRTKAWGDRLQHAQFKWPKSLVIFLHIPQLKDKYSALAREQEEALYRSGYLVHIPVDLTNGFTEALQIAKQLNRGIPPDARETYLQLFMANSYGTLSEDTNHVVIVCRTNDEARCRQALNITNSDIARPSTFDLRPSTPK